MTFRFATILCLFLIQACASTPGNHLTRTIQHSDVEGVRQALEQGHNPNQSPFHNSGSFWYSLSPMHLAAQKRAPQEVTIIKTLLAHGGDPNIRDSQGSTPLHYAQSGFIVDALVEAGADVNIQNDHLHTPLHYHRGVEVARALLENGADPTIRNKEGNTPAEQTRKDYNIQAKKLTNPLNQANVSWIQGLLDRNAKIYKLITGEALPAEEERQAQIASTSGSPSDKSASLVLNNNQGQYLNPYTSDGVVAEWVDKAINAGIGSAAGSAVGAAVGQQVASQALDNMPFGGLLGGMLGSKMGKSAGRQAAIEASGGWDYIRQTSDQSFRSLDHMARYLVNQYGNEGTFAEVISATTKIYPGLQDALARVNR